MFLSLIISELGIALGRSNFSSRLVRSLPTETEGLSWALTTVTIKSGSAIRNLAMCMCGFFHFESNLSKGCRERGDREDPQEYLSDFCQTARAQVPRPVDNA